MRAILFMLVAASILPSTLMSQPQFRQWADPMTNPNQTLHTYGQATDFPWLRMSSDFGPRQLGNDEYAWHGGLDFNSDVGDNDLGDLILALEGGVISEYSNMTVDLKSLLIEGEGAGGHNLRYVHVFEDGVLDPNPEVGQSVDRIATGGCILKYMNAPDEERWVIVVQNNGIYSAHGYYPQGLEDVPQVTFRDENGMERTIDVSRTVAADAALAPLGTSGGYAAHLHLELLTQTNHNGAVIEDGNDTYVKDVSLLYDHDQTDFNLNFYQQNDQDIGFETCIQLINATLAS